ncbi:MAG: hypothetical protein CVV28_10525 [Methanobacteriales archaeon HGW-Methanobacteriales-1]|jgi:hypothetical protein|nr:MAG: hypothetical protein CVV28_10525 [Methanobacteriales archaeon HGW-Methanobacteriales-1]
MEILIIPLKKVLEEGVFRIASHYILTENSVYLVWNNIDICQISKGKEIIVNSRTGVDETFLRALILGPALGILLHQRGRLVLHASAVHMNDVAVAFMGHNGAGKSTTTFSFMNSGYPLIADDILSIEFRDNTPVVYPGLPRIKLWPESMEIFDKSMKTFPIHPESRKRSYFVEDFCNQVVSLKHIYAIENKDKTYLEELNPQEALIELIRNSYCANIFQNSDQAENLEEYGKIVKNVSIKQLNIERSLDKIPEMVNLVEKDVILK